METSFDLKTAIAINDRLIKVSDVRKVFLKRPCVGGLNLFIENCGFNWREAVRIGIPASKLYEIDDFRIKEFLIKLYSLEE